MESHVPDQSASGGKAEAAGAQYEALVIAWYCTQVLLGSMTQPPLDLPSGALLVRVASQRSVVDDVNIDTSEGGRIYVQAKRSVSLSRSQESAFARTLEQFVRQYQLGAPEESGSRPLDGRDRLVLVTRSGSSSKIVEVLARMLQGVRDSSRFFSLPEVATTQEERDVGEAVNRHLERIFAELNGVGPTPEAMRSLLRRLWIQTLDLEGSSDTRRSLVKDLRHILESAKQAEAAFSILLQISLRIRAGASEVDEDALKQALTRGEVTIRRRGTSLLEARPRRPNERNDAESEEKEVSTPAAKSGADRRAQAVWKQKIPGVPYSAWPRMASLPSGDFLLGSKAGNHSLRHERPQQRVRIDYALAVGLGPVTVGQFAAFARETRLQPGSPARVFSRGGWRFKLGISWRNPGFPQTPEHPVTCVSWDDAQAYCSWLNAKLGLADSPGRYRLLSETEWEYACRAGTATVFNVGEKISPEHANFDHDRRPGEVDRGARVRGTTPVCSYAANAFGLYDMHGNVWEWCQDRWHESYHGIPLDGSAWEADVGNQRRRVARGGSFNSESFALRSARRGRCNPEERDFDQGFRVARTLL